MILGLRLLFSLILVTMLWVTTTASLQENILQIPAHVTTDPWFVATMFDAYFGFLTFYIWAWYRSPSWPSRIVWFILIMLLGNMAMALFVLRIVLRLPKDAPVTAVLLRPEHQAILERLPK